MYIPKFNQEKDVGTLQGLIKDRPFGSWSTLAGGEIVVNHLPFVLHADRGEFGTLVGHVSRANKIFENVSTEVDSVVAFQGEQSYITPSWYAAKHEHGKVVPTWNYIVVHAHGIPTVIEDSEWLVNHLTEITDIHEYGEGLPWKVSDAPSAFIEKLTNAIVGIEIPITKLVGKWKLGQNRPYSDQESLVSGLNDRNTIDSIGLAERLNRKLRKP